MNTLANLCTKALCIFREPIMFMHIAATFTKVIKVPYKFAVLINIDWPRSPVFGTRTALFFNGILWIFHVMIM